MQQKGIKNIIFDFGGVLINLNRRRCIDSFKALGLNNVDEWVDSFAQQGVFMELERGSIDPSCFRDRICTLTGVAIADERIDEAWNSMLMDIPDYKLEALLKLRANYSVYLLSNTNAIHWHWACEHAFHYKNFCVEDYFDEIFLSYEMNLMKPDRRIFSEVLERTEILPGETLFIDDSEANCRAADTLGISTYLCRPGEDWRHLFF